MRLIVERVYIRDQEVVALTLKSDYVAILGNNTNGSTVILVDPEYPCAGMTGLNYARVYA